MLAFSYSTWEDERPAWSTLEVPNLPEWHTGISSEKKTAITTKPGNIYPIDVNSKR